MLTLDSVYRMEFFFFSLLFRLRKFDPETDGPRKSLKHLLPENLVITYSYMKNTLNYRGVSLLG